jgi:hypothetical protein
VGSSRSRFEIMNSDSRRRVRPDHSRHACISCRQRKLKCDRKQPCANCTARSVDCRQQQLPSTASQSVQRPQEDLSTLPDILSRLDRIEAFINQTHGEGSRGYISTPVRSHPLGAEDNDTPTVEEDGALTSRARNESIITEGGEMVSISANDDILV